MLMLLTFPLPPHCINHVKSDTLQPAKVYNEVYQWQYPHSYIKCHINAHTFP